MYFVSVPASVKASPKLSATAKLLYGVLRFYQYGNDNCWPTTATLAHALGVCRDSISRAIRQLEDVGLLQVERRFKRSSIYIVKPVMDEQFSRIPANLLAVPGMSATEKLLIASLTFKSNNESEQAWPHQATLAAELGCSRSTVLRSLEKLENEHRIQVRHRGGGRARGNFYRVNGDFNCLNLQHGEAKSVAKADTKHKNPIDSKNKTGFTESNFGTLSDDRQDKAYRLLMRHGVHREVAYSLVYEQRHPPGSIVNAVANAITRQASFARIDPFRAEVFKVGGYIVASLNGARRENHTVKKSNRTGKVQADKKWQPLTEAVFTARRRKMKAALFAAAG